MSRVNGGWSARALSFDLFRARARARAFPSPDKNSAARGLGTDATVRCCDRCDATPPSQPPLSQLSARNFCARRRRQTVDHAVTLCNRRRRRRASNANLSRVARGGPPSVIGCSLGSPICFVRTVNRLLITVHVTATTRLLKAVQ